LMPPQWGDNSKEGSTLNLPLDSFVSVPAMGR